MHASSKSALALVLIAASLASPAYAKVAHHHAAPAAQTPAPQPVVPLAPGEAPPLDVDARQVILIDVPTSTVMYAKEADTRMAPSSMTKMLTMYLVFEALKDGKLHMDDLLTVSENAWRQGQDGSSTMFLNIGQQVRVEDLMRGVIIQSGNDAATVLAEKLGGGLESAFAEMMNAKATQLGMSNSHFTNASGLPDPNNYATARDLATLGLALMRDFPEDYHYFSELNFAYNGHPQGNRNPLLYKTSTSTASKPATPKKAATASRHRPCAKAAASSSSSTACRICKPAPTNPPKSSPMATANSAITPSPKPAT